MGEIFLEKDLQESALKYFNGDLLASNVWIKKYALKNKEGYYEELSPDGTIKRITKEIYRIEVEHPNPLSYEEIYETLKDFKYFIFGGSILFGCGNKNAVSSLGNCFFIDNGADSYGGIFNLDESMVQLMKRRGGVGITLEHLRPNTALVNNSAHSSTGAVSFMNRFSTSTREVAQDGRRGALMISMDCNHPNIDEFILSKDDLTKITGANISVKITDDFMNAAKNDEDYILSWPIKNKISLKEQIPYNKLIKLNDDSYVKRIKAKDIWNIIIKQAHKNAEPGILFWDNIIKESPADSYKKFGFETRGTNPCITGDTLVAVADGRNSVSIKQLAEEGNDIPVYCLNDKEKIEIQLMRNPRITGYNVPIYEVKLDSGDSIKCTSNHKIRLKDGSYKEAKDLKYGDSLHISTISYHPIVSDKNKTHKKNYRWINSGEEIYGKGFSEHRLIYEFNNGVILENNIIHHKDFNSLNNNVDNLKMMSKKDHDEYHASFMIGDKNPYFKMTDDWKRSFASHPGLSDRSAYQISNEELIKKGIEFAKSLGRRFSDTEWENYAQKNNLPKFIREYRGFNNSSEFGLYIANLLEFEYNNEDHRTIVRYKKAIENGYTAKIVNGVLSVERTCEECGNKFWAYYDQREHSICSMSCSNLYVNKNTDTNIRRTETINKVCKIKGEQKSKDQVRIYSNLKFELGRDPWQTEWSAKCKELKVSDRLKTKYGLKSYAEIKEYAKSYNHKVVSVTLIGNENVYNGTIDKYHNFFTIFKPFDEVNQINQLIINQLNCGEVPLASHDSCRLGSINLFNFVENPFTKKAKFDWDKLNKIAKISQRFMDDIVDLEEKKILDIIKKVENDQEDYEIRRTELNLWKKILDVLKKGRRTGLGILGLADTFAALNIDYGTKESTKFAEDIQKCIVINSYKESIKLAKERGCFPIWNADLEAGNPFIRRVIVENFDNKEYDEYLKYGRRNIANIAIAPTGSLASLTQTTSGIEPVFKIFYRRRRKINPNESDSKISFVDQNGDSWEEYSIIHYPFIEWVKINSDGKFTFNDAKVFLENLSEEDFNKLIAKSPWAKSESHNIDYIEKINMVGLMTKFIDHSVSMTINLPEKITIEEVNNIYFHGWKAGCKGLTIYRENSRSGVLLSKKEDEDFKETKAPKRPKILESDYYVAKAEGKDFAVVVGLFKGKPYEIFAFENPPMNKNVKGKTIKVKKGHYKFVNGEFEIENLQLAAERKEERTLTLTASMLLRYGAPINHINHVITKIDENITSFSSVVRRYLSRYITEELNGESCPECGEKLIMQDSCIKCVNPDCMYSKCS